MLKKLKLGNFLIFLSVFVCFLNGYVTAQPSEERLKAFRSVKTVRIIVEQSYDEAKGVSLPFEEVAGRLLRYAGLKVVGADAKDYDATLMIQVKGEAKGALYKPELGPSYGYLSYHYSGAFLKGMISLVSPGIAGYKKSFGGSVYPPYRIFSAYTTPSSAPFHTAFRSDFLPTILEIIQEIYGPSPLIAALKDEDEDVRARVAWVLGEKKDPLAIELLIAALKDKDSGIRVYAAHALGYIGDRNAFPALKKALNDKDERVCKAAKGALDRIETEARAGYYLRLTYPYNTIHGEFDEKTLLVEEGEVFFIPKVESNYGFGVSLGLRYHPLDFELNYFSSTHDIILPWIWPTPWRGAKSEAVYDMLNFNYKHSFSSSAYEPTQPYFLFGTGFSWLTVKDGAATAYSVGDAVFRSVFSINIGGGITYYLNPKVFISGEVIYRWRAFEQVKGIYGEWEEVDLDGSGLDLNVGIAYTF